MSNDNGSNSIKIQKSENLLFPIDSCGMNLVFGQDESIYTYKLVEDDISQ